MTFDRGKGDSNNKRVLLITCLSYVRKGLPVLLAFMVGRFSLLPLSFHDQKEGINSGTSTSTSTSTRTSIEKSSSMLSDTCLSLQVGTDINNRIIPESTDTDKCLLYQTPSDLVQVTMNFVVGTPNQGTCNGGTGGCSQYRPYVEQQRAYGNDWPPYGYTMIGTARLENFRAAIQEVNRNQIAGAIIETGVWRGGAMIMAAVVTKESHYYSNRDLYLYDAFETLPGYGGHAEYLQNSQSEVETYFGLFEIDVMRRSDSDSDSDRDDPKQQQQQQQNNIHFVKGLFKDTVPLWKKGTPIAVLRVDGNFYDSYSDVMYAMYEHVAVGGFVIFDDIMSHQAVVKFWLDFLADQGIVQDLNRIDTHSAWFRKKEKVTIDASKRHPPQQDVKI